MKSYSCIAGLPFAATTAAASFWQTAPGLPPYGATFAFPPPSNATYDYVVVGGGTAGLVVASRLAATRNLTVGVVEAGTFYELTNSNYSQVPAYSENFVSGDTEIYLNKWIDWDLNTVPQPQLGDKVIHYAQGKCLGGSSGRNQMIYQRGTRGSYDQWAEEVGDASYRWDNILQFFKKSTTFTPPNMELRASNASSVYDASEYGTMSNVTSFNKTTSAPLHVSYPNTAMPFSSWGIKALKMFGLKSIPGFSSGDLTGVSYDPFTIDPTDETRSSSETSFLQQAIAEGLPLTVHQLTQAQKILFDENKRATGVQVESALGGGNFTLFARNEVIVSAGAFHSPQLLMVSGIGPSDTLSNHGIEVVSDRPGVGQNMHDSVNINGVTHEVSIPTASLLQNDAEFAAKAVEQYITNGTGFLTNIGSDALAFTKLPEKYRAQLSNSTLEDLSHWAADWPEIEYTIVSSGRALEEAQPGSHNYATVGLLMVAALSRGNVTINSSSMKDKPIISTNWLLDPGDQEVAVQSIRTAREIWSYIPETIRGKEVSPGQTVTTDAQILQSVRENIAAIHHATSTCMMGKESEEMAVVDSKAKVFGVDGLRVIDSSSFRFTPPGHTQAATYCHAEKLVHDILEGLSSY